jgi:hypothetical protein
MILRKLFWSSAVILVEKKAWDRSIRIAGLAGVLFEQGRSKPEPIVMKGVEF